MLNNKIETATAGWPKTRILKDQGMVHITGKYVDPDLKERSFRVGFFCWIVFVLLLFYALYPFNGGSFTGFFFISLFSLWIFLGFLSLPWYFLKRRRINVMIGPEIIKINGKSYQRFEGTEFYFENYHKAIRDQDKMNMPSHYASALDVVMQYGERSVVIASFRGRDKEKAKALLIRLQDWSNRFDKLKDMSVEGEEPSPADQDKDSGDFGVEPVVR